MSVALGFQRTKDMRRIVLFSVICLVWLYNIFTHHPIKSTIFGKIVFGVSRVYVP